MSKTLAILGSGDLGQQIAHYAISDKKYDEVVFFDDFTDEVVVCGYKVIGTIQEVEEAYQNKIFDEILIGIGYKHISVRKELFNRFHGKIPFGTLIHSNSWIDNTAIIKEGVVIYPNCCVDAYSTIDCNSIINISCSIAHNTYLGKHCFFSPRVAIAGFVEVKEQCIIGINTTIIDNIKIVSETQLGAGTVVIKNIEIKGLYVGNPAKFIR
jgi:sugar O-acyltransferase (sialic acid O-acetyltransferase NeuD family)